MHIAVAMNEYTLRQLVREVEWNARVALATADDLHEAVEERDSDDADAVLESLMLRVQKVVELLWPGRYRLADRVYAEASARARELLGVDADSLLTHQHCAPLYALLQQPVDAVSAGHGSFDLRVRVADRTTDLGPMLRALSALWNRSAGHLVDD